MNKKVIFVLAALVLMAAACGGTTTGNTGAEVLFQDDFSDTGSGWDRASGDLGSTDYASGGYQIVVNQPDGYAFGNPYQNFQNDVRIEVDATKTGGPDDNAFGVQCRYQDVDNYYFFYISSDGYAGIGIDNAGTKSIISSADGNMVSVENINQGGVTNHIRVDCIGSTLTLYVNGTQVLTATDSTFSGGDTGLVAKSFDITGVQILFDNLFVYKP